MSRDRRLLLQLVFAALPYLRRGLVPVGETKRHETLRLAVRAAVLAVDGRYSGPLLPASPTGPELAQAWLVGVLGACDALGLPRSEIVAIVNDHARLPAPRERAAS